MGAALAALGNALRTLPDGETGSAEDRVPARRLKAAERLVGRTAPEPREPHTAIRGQRREVEYVGVQFAAQEWQRRPR
jgi:hypothetical protein